MSKSKNGNGHAGSGVFGSPDRVLVKRALAEFRSNRPVMFSSAAGKFHVALPVDGDLLGLVAGDPGEAHELE